MVPVPEFVQKNHVPILIKQRCECYEQKVNSLQDNIKLHSTISIFINTRKWRSRIQKLLLEIFPQPCRQIRKEMIAEFTAVLQGNH